MSPPNPFPDSDLAQGPARAFRFCPRCGVAEPRIERGGRVLRCEHCGFLFFFNSATAAGAFVFHQGQLILCIRAKDPGQGMWDLPGGFIEFGETVEDGLRREIQEELNIATSDYRYLMSAPNDYLYAGVPYKTTDLFYICRAADVRGLKAADDVADYCLIAPAELDPGRLAFASARVAAGALQEWLRHHAP